MTLDLPPLAPGRTLMARLDELATFSDDARGLTRLYLSPAHRAAADRVATWMREAGLATSIDAAGTVVGRREGRNPAAAALLLGSHIDSVRNAGKYDGPLGVLSAIAAVEELQRRGIVLPFAIEVLAFGDEEGVRFPTTFSGSRAVAGTFDLASLDARDARGITLADALRTFGCDPGGIPDIARRREDVLGYVEVHIEQGPVLEQRDRPVGVVSAITGVSRYRVVVTGTAGHAGTVPMPMRRDALAGAAEMILAIEQLARSLMDVVATVGVITLPDAAANVVPGEVTFTIDLRSPVDATRRKAEAALRAVLADVATRRSLGLAFEPYLDVPATPCDPRLAAGLAEAIEAVTGSEAPRLFSGAGHDGMAIAPLCPIAMMFVRCKGGISHNPAESITVEDADLTVRILVQFLENFERASRP